MLEVILQCKRGDSYQLNMVTQLEQWSKQKAWILMRFSNEMNTSAEKYVVKQLIFSGSIR